MVQSWVRMWLVRTRFRRTTAAGRKAAARSARQARFVAAAVVIQKNVRRHLACKKVRLLLWVCRHFIVYFVILTWVKSGK